MSETPIKILKAVQDERPISVKKEQMVRNLSETKYDVKDKRINSVQAQSQAQRFSFKQYIKTQISKENGTYQYLTKNDDKNQHPDYVQQLIDLKHYIQKTNFLHQYKQKYFTTQENQKEYNSVNCQNSSKNQDNFKVLNITTQNNDSAHKKISLHQDQQLNQQKHQLQSQQQQIQFQSQQEKRQQSKFGSDQSHQAKKSSAQSLSTFSTTSHSNFNKFSILEGTQIMRNSNSDRQFQSLRAAKQPEIKIEDPQTQQQVDGEDYKKQSENLTIKKIIHKRQILITQNTLEDIDDGQSSGEEFDLNIIPKSKHIFKINKNLPSQINYQSVPSHSRQSLDINILSAAQKYRPIATEEDEIQTDQLQNDKKHLDSSETVSQKLKQIVAKRKFASENIQSQQIKNLRKLIPQAFERIEKKKHRGVSRSPLYPLQRKADQFEEIKTLNSQASINQIPISSEETDIDLNEVLKANRLRSDKNRSSITSIQNYFTKDDQVKEKETEKLRIIVKGVQKPQKIVKQVRSQSVNNNFSSQKNNLRENESQELYPMINVLLCSNKNVDCSTRYKDLNTLLNSLSQQERPSIIYSSTMNDLSQQTSNQHSDQASPLSISNQQIPEGSKSLSKDHSQEGRNPVKKQTIKFGQIKHLLQQEGPHSEKKDKFVNYHLLFKESMKKDSTRNLLQRSKRSRSSLQNQYITNPTSILQNNQNNTKQSQQTNQLECFQPSYPIKVQTLLYATSTSTCQQQSSSSATSTINPLLKNQIKNLKQLNATSILDKTNKPMNVSSE